MAKDARGHGSNPHGGGNANLTGSVAGAAHQIGVQDVGKNPTFTQKHFEMIAATLAQHAAQVRTNPIAHDALVANFADKLSKTNPKFDKARFTRAAGGH